MPSYKSVTYKCSECEQLWYDTVDREKESDTVECPVCGGDANVTISAVTVLKASYPDGTKRAGFAELREASKLEKEMYDKPTLERGELRKAIKELKSTDKKGD